MLVERALGVDVPIAAPLLPELAGDGGADAMLYCTGWIGGLPVGVWTASAKLGGE